MFLRAVTLAGGIAGAAGLSQFPEFSQQYVQRLSGKVEELTLFVENFDADAADLGMSREAALVDLAKGGDMGQARAETMVATIARQARLSHALERVKSAGPFTRAYNAGAFSDAEVARGTLKDYKPALPLTFEGAVFAGTGFLAGLGALGALIWLIRLPFRREDEDGEDRAPPPPPDPPGHPA